MRRNRTLEQTSLAFALTVGIGFTGAGAGTDSGNRTTAKGSSAVVSLGKLGRVEAR